MNHKILLLLFIGQFILTALSGQCVLSEKKSEIQINDSILLTADISCVSKDSLHFEKVKTFDSFLISDNELVFGTDGEVPITKLDKLRLIVKGKNIDLETSSMYNPNGKSLDIRKSQFDISLLSPEVYILKGVFSDGAGTYIAEWLIVQDVSVRIKLGLIE